MRALCVSPTFCLTSINVSCYVSCTHTVQSNVRRMFKRALAAWGGTQITFESAMSRPDDLHEILHHRSHDPTLRIQTREMHLRGSIAGEQYRANPRSEDVHTTFPPLNDSWKIKTACNLYIQFSRLSTRESTQNQVANFILHLSMCVWGHLGVWGELASHKRPTAPVLKAGHLSVP